MMMGPDPIKRIDLRSVRLGILTSFLQMSLLLEGIETGETIGSVAQNFKGDSKAKEPYGGGASNGAHYAKVGDFGVRTVILYHCPLATEVSFIG